jgi:uncharacterized protein YeaO (DUF488 family)
MSIELRRVYEDGVHEPGRPFLVDRLWPRGKRKVDLEDVMWLKDVAPSDPLRRWFAHEPSRWDEFVRRYQLELDAHPDAWRPLLAAAKRGHIVLLYAAKDEEHNNAVALKGYIDRKLAKRRSTRGQTALVARIRSRA